MTRTSSLTSSLIRRKLVNKLYSLRPLCQLIHTLPAVISHGTVHRIIVKQGHRALAWYVLRLSAGMCGSASDRLSGPGTATSPCCSRPAFMSSSTLCFGSSRACPLTRRWVRTRGAMSVAPPHCGVLAGHEPGAVYHHHGTEAGRRLLACAQVVWHRLTMAALASATTAVS